MKGRFLFLIVLPVLVMISSVGIFMIEGVGESPFTSLFNSLWWTVVTFTTVGYGDMSPVTVPGRSFGILILATGVLINSIIISMISNWFFSLKSGREQGLKDIRATGHVLVCSDSPVFIHSVLAENMSFVKQGKAVIVTPLNRHPLIGSALEGVPWVQGDSYRLDILKKASADKARISYVSFKDDADTVMTVMQLEVVSPSGMIKTMAQYQIHDFKAHLFNVGCDYAIKSYDVYVPLMLQSVVAQGSPVWIRELILRLVNRPNIHTKALDPAHAGNNWLEYSLRMKATKGEHPLAYLDQKNQLFINPPAETKLDKSYRILAMVPALPDSLGDREEDGISLEGFEEIPTEGHIVICSDEAPFIDRILRELRLARVEGDIVVLSKLPPFKDAQGVPGLEWVQAKSYSDYGLNQARAGQAKIAFIDHERDSHTLMAVLRVEDITGGKIFSVASYREPGFDERLHGVGCDYCNNVDEMVAPILYQTAIHPGIGRLVERIISFGPDKEGLAVKALSPAWEPSNWLDCVEKIKKETGCLPVGLIRTQSLKLLVNPHPTMEVTPGDGLVLITDQRGEPNSPYLVPLY